MISAKKIDVYPCGGFALADLLLVCFACIGTLLIFEGVLQVVWRDGEVLLYEQHPRYLHQIRPNVRKRHVHLPENGGHTVISEYNEHGFRGGAVKKNKADAFRVMVYGDSNITAKFSEQAATFTAQVEQRLVSEIGEVEVINAGVPGYGPDQASLRIEDQLPVFEPDLLIVHIYAGNDFGDLIRNKLFEIDDHGELKSRTPTLTTELRLKLLLGRIKTLRYAKLAWMNARNTPVRSEPNELPVLSDEAIETKYRSSRIHKAFVSYRDNDKVTNLFDDYSARISLFPGAESSVAAIGLMGGVLSRIDALAKQNDVPWMVLIQPASVDISTVVFPGFMRFKAQYPEYRQSTATDVIQTLCEERGIPFVNLFDIFVANEPDELHLKTDGHWNDRGQALAADAVYRFLSERSELIPDTAVPE